MLFLWDVAMIGVCCEKEERQGNETHRLVRNHREGASFMELTGFYGKEINLKKGSSFVVCYWGFIHEIIRTLKVKESNPNYYSYAQIWDCNNWSKYRDWDLLLMKFLGLWKREAFLCCFSLLLFEITEKELYSQELQDQRKNDVWSVGSRMKSISSKVHVQWFNFCNRM